MTSCRRSIALSTFCNWPGSVVRSWRGIFVRVSYYFLLPFLEQDQLYTQWYPYPRQTIPPGAIPPGTTLDYIPMQAYLCPSDPSPTSSNGGVSLVTLGGANVWAPGNYGMNYLVFGDPPNGSTEGAA